MLVPPALGSFEPTVVGWLLAAAFAVLVWEVVAGGEPPPSSLRMLSWERNIRSSLRRTPPDTIF